jgi:Ca2+-binding RTX toxin-like protein
MLSYEDAQTAALSASAAPFVHPAYVGGTADLGYLRDWVLDQVVAIYGGSASDFDLPTLYSTTILRDFVHRALYQIEPSVPTLTDIGPAFLGWEVASGFRYPVQGSCGLLAWQMWEVFRAFGYDTRQVDSIDGDVGSNLATNPDTGTYSDSHVSSEVYVVDLDKWVVQDATYNFLYKDTQGDFLSWYEARAQIYQGFILEFVGFHDYQSFQVVGSYSEQITPSQQYYFETHYLKLPWSWIDSDGTPALTTFLLYPDALTAHQAGSDQGSTFTNIDEALIALSTDSDWLTLAQSLRSQGFYVSGFALVEEGGLSHWLTVRLGDGSYVSVNLETKTVLNGSYDQLVNDATGGPGATDRALLNPAANINAFLDPAYLLAYNGELMDGGVPQNRSLAAGTVGADSLLGLMDPDVLYGLDGDDLLNGADGNDVLVGGVGTDVLIGGSGQDYLLGGDGVDLASYEGATSGLMARLDNPALNTGEAAGDSYSSVEGLRGTSYSDSLSGDANSNLLEGSGGNDSLWGYGGGDVFSGGDGNDYMVGATGADSFDGGAGVDTVSYETATSGLMARLDVPGINTGEAAGDSYSNIEGLRGTNYTDTLCGDANGNLLEGSGGNDSLWGYGGGDVFSGGDGNDYMVGEAGADSFDGGTGIDTISYYFAGSGVTVYLSGSGTQGEAAGDVYANVESVLGSAYGDTLCGTAGVNALIGSNGDDSLWGYGGGDVFSGGDGNDYMVGATGADSFDGGNGVDTVSYYFASSAVTVYLSGGGTQGEAVGDVYANVESVLGSAYGDTLCGTAGANALIGSNGDDSLWGYGGGDVLSGGDGNDYMVGEAGADSFDGGTGVDTVSYEAATSGLVARLDNSSLNTGEAAGDSYSGVEGLRGTSYSDTLGGDANSNLIEGSGGDDALWGYGGGDVFSGGDGNDYMVGAAGADSFDGGTGVDTVSYEAATSGLMARLDVPGINTGEAAGDSYSSVEGLHGTNYADTLCGDASGNRLEGSGGDDSLWGYGGGDVFSGGDGNDYMVGATGADSFDGGTGVDIISYYFAGSAVTVYLSGSGTQGEAAGDVYANVEGVLGSAYGDTLCGTAGANSLIGWQGDDQLWGYGGGDVFSGGDGNDYMVGATGADSFDGGTGVDTVSYYFAGSAVTVYLSGTGTQGEAAGDVYVNVESVLGSAYGDTLCGTAGANSLIGAAGDDSLWGYGGNDTLIAGDGNDVLYGGVGNDAMAGGMGADAFMWQSGEAGTAGAPQIDTLVDFDLAGGDTVNLDDLLQGEAANTLDSFLFFEKVGSDTILHVSSAGALTPGDSIAAIHGKEDLQVIFQGVDLFSIGDNQAIIHDLFTPLLAA